MWQLWIVCHNGRYIANIAPTLQPLLQEGQEMLVKFSGGYSSLQYVCIEKLW
jgi:hypothetical protein